MILVSEMWRNNLDSEQGLSLVKEASTIFLHSEESSNRKGKATKYGLS